jgi:hypothetical protein
MENKYFNQALSDFTHDVASGQAICHLWDIGYNVQEIQDTLDYPTPRERIRQTVWKHLLDNGTICLEDPVQGKPPERAHYIKEYGAYGKTSYRKVVEQNVPETASERKYVRLDFGKQQYQNPETFEKWMETLEPKDRTYICDLPWPLQPVYHLWDERMERMEQHK